MNFDQRKIFINKAENAQKPQKKAKITKIGQKNDPLLVFADFHAEGVYGGTFCIKDESKLRTQWFIIAIFKKIYGLVFG